MHNNSRQESFKVVDFGTNRKRVIAYATSYWSSIVTLVLSSPFQRYGRFSAEKSDLTPIPPEFWGCSPWTRLLMLRLRGAKEDPKLIFRVINFELVQPIHPRYINVTDRQTDRRTTYALYCVHCTVKTNGICFELRSTQRNRDIRDVDYRPGSVTEQLNVTFSPMTTARGPVTAAVPATSTHTTSQPVKT